MSNQDLNELRDINKQLEKLQNQKRIIQQKLQDENDMMMVENHLFSQPDIQDLIQEIEKDFPDFKINIDYKENEIAFNHNNWNFFKTKMIHKNQEKNKKELVNTLQFQLSLKNIYKILNESNYSIKNFQYQFNNDFVIKAYNKLNEMYVEINLKTNKFDNKIEISQIKTYRRELEQTYNLFKLNKYNIQIDIKSHEHYDSYNGDNIDDLFSIEMSHIETNVNINNIQEKLKNGIKIVKNAAKIWIAHD